MVTFRIFYYIGFVSDDNVEALDDEDELIEGNN